MRARKLALAIVLASLTAYPAQSADFFGNLGNLAGNFVTGWPDLESRAATIETSIADGLKTGKLTATQATDLRAELKRILDAETQLKASGKRMSFAQSISFGNEISTLSQSVDQAMQHRVANLPDVDTLATTIESQISTGLQSGHIDAQTGDKFKADLRSIRDVQAAYKEADGNLNPRQIEIVGGRLTKLKGELDRQVQIGQSAVPAMTARRTAIGTKVDTALTSGKLTAQEAADFKAQLDKIAAEQNSYISGSTGIISGPQVYNIARELDTVDDAIEAKLSLGATATFPPGNWQGRAGGPGPDGNWQGRAGGPGPDGNWQGRAGGPGPDGNWQGRAGGPGPDNNWQGRAGGPGPGSNWQGRAGGPGPGSNWQGRAGGPGPDGNWQGRAGGPGPDGNWQGGGRRQGRRNGNWQGRDAGGPQDGPTDETTGSQPTDTTVSSLPTTTTTPPASGTFAIGDLPILSPKNFSDVGGFWAQTYIEDLASRGVIGGFPNGTFKPNDQITRAQFAAIVASALKLAPVTGRNNFNDVPAKYWASGVIGAASNAGLITGYPDGTFRPEDKITRAQALVILSKALHSNNSATTALNAYSDATAIPPWASAAVAQAANAHIIVSFPDAKQIRPNELATRGDVAGLMYQTLTALGAQLPAVRIGVLADR